MTNALALQHNKKEGKMHDMYVGRDFLTYLWNVWTYFNETYNSYSLLGPHDMMTSSRSWV